jgi:cytochrome b6-f complex iron-sulfur subunit
MDKNQTEDKEASSSKGCQQLCGGGGCSNSHDDDEHGVDRGNFIKGCFAACAVAWGGLTLSPIVAYLIPPAGDNDGKANVTSLEVCKLEELPKGTGRNFRFGSFPALLIHTGDGQLHAFNAICTHLGCTVQFRNDMEKIYCACHGGEYDPNTGQNIAGPPPKPLTALKTEVVNGKIIVSRA